MRRLLPTLIAGMLLGALLPAAASADATVSVGTSAAFAPTDVSIQEGQKVTWNFGSATGSHNIVVLPAGAAFPAEAPSATSAEYNFPADGTTHVKTFASAGTFRYLCTLHYFPGILEMKGTVTVTGSTPPPPPPPPPTGALPPEPVAVASDRTAPFTAEIATLTGSEAGFKSLTSTGGE